VFLGFVGSVVFLGFVGFIVFVGSIVFVVFVGFNQFNKLKSWQLLSHRFTPWPRPGFREPENSLKLSHQGGLIIADIFPFIIKYKSFEFWFSAEIQ